jgi:PAS domain S-box-containing protein
MNHRVSVIPYDNCPPFSREVSAIPKQQQPERNPPISNLTGTWSDTRLGVLIAALTGIIFIFDIVTPLSLVVWTLYLIPLFLTVYVRQRNAPLYMAGAIVLLSTGGIFLSVADIPVGNALINRVFFFAVISVVAFFIWNYRNGVLALDESREELRKTAVLLESHIGNSPLAIIEFDARFRITRWTGEAARIFGWAPEEVMEKAIGEFPWVYEDDIPRVTAISADMLEGRSASNMHANRNYRKDGTVIECEWYNSAIRDGAGNLVSILSQIIDVTARNRADAELEQKNQSLAATNEELTAVQEELRQNIEELAKGEQALRESEAKYRTLFETMAEGFSIDEIIFDGAGKPVDLRYLLVNPAFERQRGKPAGEMVGRRCSQIFPGTQKVWFERYGEVVTTGTPAHFEEKFGPLSRWYEVRAYKTGTAQLAVIFTDITDRRETEENRALMQEILRAINAGGELHPMIRGILGSIRDSTGFDAVGIRLKMGDEFPYFEQNGFPDDFLLEEDFLCARHGDGSITRGADGKAVLECTCGLILSGRTDPTLPCFTCSGSFWTNPAGPIILEHGGRDPRINPHDRCAHDGYQSVALIPIKSGGVIIGMLQLNDRRAKQFNPERIRLFESVADNIGLAIRRGQAEEELKGKNIELAAANEELTATDEELRQNIDELGKKEQELTVTNDELNATNEELSSTQEELRHNIEELGRSEEILRANETELRESLEEKEVLLSEIHHRVKNNLTAFISLLSLEGSYSDTPEGQALRLDLQNRARSMALVHETLYKTKKYSQVDMGVYLSTLVNQIATTFPAPKAVQTFVSAEGVTIDIARATPCGLIINELMTNAFKHAFTESSTCGGPGLDPCSFRVGLARGEGYYTLSVSDNGVGLPATVDIKTAKSLGLKLVHFLARHQLRATVDVEVSGGTRYTIRFKE